MLDQLKSIAITGIVRKLNEYGVNVDAPTVERALANCPNLLQQIEGIMATTDSKERIIKIQALLKDSLTGECATTTATTGVKEKTK